MGMQDQVIQFIQSERLLSAGDNVVIGVSGGPDSLCLLHLFDKCRDRLAIRLHVAHLNHLIRGTDAEADAEFVASFAAQLDVPCTIAKCDIPAIARRNKLAIEEAARRARYAFLMQVASQIGATRIAVGHNADDQSETILMHWLRGAGLAGLRGMLPATPMADLRLIAPPTLIQERDTWLIRPLLQTPRAEIEHYCTQHNLNPRFDRSNLDTTLFRNKLRHELLPYLEQVYKPNFSAILRRSAQVIREDYDLLSQLRNDAWERTIVYLTTQVVAFDRAIWRSLHHATQRALVRQAVQHLRWNLRDVNFEHVKAAVEGARQGQVGARATLPRGLMLTVGYDRLFIADAEYIPPPDFPALTRDRLELAVPGSTALPDENGCVQVTVVPAQTLSGWEKNDDVWCAFVDADVLGPQPALRRRRDGDRFCPLGMKGRKKLVSELLVNEKVPAWWRDEVPLLVRPDDEIVWVCGWRIDERAKIGEHTSRVAIIRFEK
ncbi:MAG: tRNA lysidine(34) synthetase TilS [Anaerolineae bacterium]|nr:tRNA lysidine(34) synthetase TilS [Anaerolineae bacterium]